MVPIVNANVSVILIISKKSFKSTNCIFYLIISDTYFEILL